MGIKDNLVGLSCNTHQDVKLEILPTLIEVFLRHLSICRRKVFYEDGYNKINELSSYKGISFLDLTPSEIKPWNWIPKNAF